MISADVKLINAKQKIKRSGSCISKFFIRSTFKCQNMVSSINRDTPCFEIHPLPDKDLDPGGKGVGVLNGQNLLPRPKHDESYLLMVHSDDRLKHDDSILHTGSSNSSWIEQYAWFIHNPIQTYFFYIEIIKDKNILAWICKDLDS